MDNMSPNNTFKAFKKFLDVCVIVIPLMADFFSIASLFIPNLSSWINGILSEETCIAIIILLNVLMFIGFVYIYDRKKSEKILGIENIIHQYNEIIDSYEEYVYDYEKSCEKIDDINMLYTMTAEIMKMMIDKMKDVLHDVTGQKVRVCIKSFAEKYDAIDQTNMELITFCRSDKDLMFSGRERSIRVKLNENTDFNLIMSNNTSYPYFAYNGLTTFEKHTGVKYMNSTDGWDERYNATIVHPICKCIETEKNGKQKYQILGFVCIDSLSVKAFTKDNAKICIGFNKAMAHLLFKILDKCISQREIIEKSSKVEVTVNA